MNWANSALVGIETLLLLYVAMTDVAARLIPNKVCLMLATLGTTGHLLTGPSQLADSLAPTAILFLVLLAMHHRGWIGGGDVKLLAALAIGLPFRDLLQFLEITALAGGVLALVHLLMRRLPDPARPPGGSSFLRRIYAIERWRNLRRAPLPYGVAIACAGIWILLSRGA